MAVLEHRGQRLTGEYAWIIGGLLGWWPRVSAAARQASY